MHLILRILKITDVCNLFVKVNMKVHLNLAVYASDYLHALAPLTPGGRAFCNHCAGGWASQRDGAEDNRFFVLKFFTVLRRNSRDLRHFCTVFVNLLVYPTVYDAYVPHWLRRQYTQPLFHAVVNFLKKWA
jgi:hypothetical protein